ncbi:MAG: hypothetical protein OHK0031_16130 [Anaerolineales bacterium]
MDIFLQSLWITLLGMGITFGVIGLFWGLMWLLTALPLRESQKYPPAAAPQDEKATAAALAVAVALAQQQQTQTAYFPIPETAFVSAWQLGMRTRQMAQKGQQTRR